MIKIQVKSAIAEGWSAFARRPLYLLGIALSFVLLFVITAGNTAVTALAAVVYSGYIALLMKHFKGSTVVFDDLFLSTDSPWISYAFLMLIKAFFILLGLLLFIVPGVYLSVRWAFAEFLVVDQGMRPLEALRASSKMTKGNRGSLFILMFVLGIFILIGAFFLIIGAIVMGIVATLALIKVYEDLKPMLTQEAEVVVPSPDIPVSDEKVVA